MGDFTQVKFIHCIGVLNSSLHYFQLYFKHSQVDYQELYIHMVGTSDRLLENKSDKDKDTIRICPQQTKAETGN